MHWHAPVNPRYALLSLLRYVCCSSLGHHYGTFARQRPHARPLPLT